jgi:predicted transcriptional regulator of viral defense system
MTGRNQWDLLYELSAAQQGYFTASQAAELGISAQALRHHVATGNLTRVQRAIYRMTRFPESDHEDMVVVWLWTNQTGVFSHETALLMHNLSDALPAKIHVTLPLDWQFRRLKLPPIVIAYYDDIADNDWEWVANFPVTKPLRTLDDCMSSSVSPELVSQAAEQLFQSGRFSYVPEILARALYYRYNPAV